MSRNVCARSQGRVWLGRLFTRGRRYCAKALHWFTCELWLTGAYCYWTTTVSSSVVIYRNTSFQLRIFWICLLLLWLQFT